MPAHHSVGSSIFLMMPCSMRLSSAATFWTMGSATLQGVPRAYRTAPLDRWMRCGGPLKVPKPEKREGNSLTIYGSLKPPASTSPMLLPRRLTLRWPVFPVGASADLGPCIPSAV